MNYPKLIIALPCSLINVLSTLMPDISTLITYIYICVYVCVCVCVCIYRYRYR